jgi:hypothetical protein
MNTSNAGLRALTTSKERKEIRAISLSDRMSATMPQKASNSPFEGLNHSKTCNVPHLRLKAAFKQKGYKHVPATWYWHVLSEGQSKHSTLSIEGLKEWKLI